MKTSRNKAYEDKVTRARLKKPKENLEFWKRETGLNIDRAYWKYGRLWFALQNREEAQNAASGKMYTLEGLQTSFDSLDPSLWRGRASWDTNGQEPEASGQSVSPGIPNENESPRPGLGIQELLREILSDQGAATPDESLLSHALGRGGDILFHFIEAFARVAAGNLGPVLPTNPVYHAPEPCRASPSPSVLSTHSRLGTVTGDLSLANSPRASARVLYDYANRSPAWQTPSPDGSFYGSGLNSNGVSPARQVSVEPPFSSVSELSDAALFMDTFEEPAQKEGFELCADCPVESIFELAADHPLYPEGHESPSVAQQVEDICDMAPSDSAPDVSLDGLPELSRDMIVGIISIPSTPIGSEGEVDWDFIPDTPPGLFTCAVTADEPKAVEDARDPKSVEAACDSSPETSIARKRRRSSSSATNQSSSASTSQVCLEGSRQPLALPPCSSDVGSSSTMIPCSLPDPEAASQPSEGSPSAESSSVGSLSVRKRRWRPDEDLEILTSPISVKKLRLEDSLVQDGGESAMAAPSPHSPISGSLAVTSTVLSDGPFPVNSDSSLMLQANPITPPLRRSRRGVQLLGHRSSRLALVPTLQGCWKLLPTLAAIRLTRSQEMITATIAGASQSSLQIAPCESTRVLRPRRGLTDDDEIAAQLERDASQASPSDQELLQYEIGPEPATASGEEDGSDAEYNPGRKPKARSRRKSKTGSRAKGKGVARDAPDTGHKQTNLDRYFS
ncbi:hypothetical protein FDENT_947 [Fusarium denticulatum]|uniref:Uncharacterized protein n=1 Tax=Fusarium denticulatum TaxID=48507 RepID=A0A8H5XJQ9_9HYPO|nr:hypothetical protein FDENT_947 [Fusarium denticulatum]